MVFQPVMPHGSLEEVLPDVFFVTGTSRPTFLGRTWQYSRNMVVLRRGRELTLVNSVRLDDDGCAALEALGEVRHVVRLGAFHGMDDAFFVGRYGATPWGLSGMEHDADIRAGAQELTPTAAPLPSTLFRFESIALPEGILLLPEHGGVAIPCDSLQNWAAPDAFFDAESIQPMRDLGFLAPCNVGPGWRMATQPAPSDFERLKQLAFEHLLPAHGAPVLGGASAAFAPAIHSMLLRG
jgi:hypothetical protein